MSIKRWSLISLGVLTAIPLGVLIAVSTVENRQASQLRNKEPYTPPVRTTEKARSIVIYFSRSGNTALAARHIAKRLQAPVVALQAPAYRLGIIGLMRSLHDARKPEAEITPLTVDLHPYDTVYLASPVWLYSPAPPIWAFARNNRFDGKHVVLFNTYNSHFAPEFIEAFKMEVMRNGAKTFEHRHILRGRMTRQLTPDEMTAAIDAERNWP